MRRLQFKFPNQIRISGWDFGSSARAMNQAGGLISTQADLEKVSRSTTERKSMSTKTSIKRIALVAVSALGLGVLTSVAPAKAAGGFNATFTAPTTLNLATGYAATDAGTIQIDLATVDTALDNTDSATVTMAANDGAVAKDVTFLGKLIFSETNTAGTATYGGSVATTYNNANGGTMVFDTTTARVVGANGGSSFATASGKVYIKVLTGLTATENGARVKFTLTATSGGLVRTFPIVLTLGIDGQAGTATYTPATLIGTIDAGGSASGTIVQPYTNMPANDTRSTSFSLGGAGAAYFSVTAVATGGSAVVVVDSATQVTVNLTKSALAGSLSVTYTITVNALSSATAGQTVTAGGFTWTVQPTTPTYSYSVVTPAANATNGYYVAASAGGDGIIWGTAADKTNAVAAFTIVQYDQKNDTITAVAYKKAVTVTVTGKGSLDSIAGTADVVTKSKAWTSTNGQLTTGNSTSVSIFSDGTSGEGTIAISVDGSVVKSYTVRFLGVAASIKATLVRPIGSTSGAVNGADGGAAAAGTAFGVATKSVTATSAPAVAVKVLDSNGWAVPTVALTSTLSDVTVVNATTRLFVDSGVSDPAALKFSAGTFVQHYSYTSNVNTSGKTATITYSFVNSSGTVLKSDPVTITLGGAVVKASLEFNDVSYNPGQAVTLTFKGLDAAGNKGYDGQNLIAGGMESTLDFGSVVSVAGGDGGTVVGGFSTATIVNGVKTRATFAPTVPGKWTITGYLADGSSYEATATVTDLTQAAQDAAGEATEAANAATDAANAAAEAADAATAAAQDAQAAVADLAAQVATLISGIKAQITRLTNLVVKIQKKVRA